MYVNPVIYSVFAAASAAFVLIDAGRRRRAETEETTDDDWDHATAGPLRWTLLALVLPALALPAYVLRSRGMAGARWSALATGLAVAAMTATFTVAPKTRLQLPWERDSVAWSKLPPGLPRSVREATEKLPVALAVQVVDILPGLVTVGQSYPGGADISVMPEDTKARVLLSVNDQDALILAGLTVYRTEGEAKKALAAEERKRSGVGRVVPGSVVERLFRHGVVVTELHLEDRAEAGPLSSRRAVLESAAAQLGQKIADALNAR